MFGNWRCWTVYRRMKAESHEEALEKMKIEIVPTGDALGAEIRGVDLKRGLTEEQTTAMKSAWQEHLVLLIRGQQISDRELVEFSCHFGVLELAPANEFTFRGNVDMPETPPEISVISNVKVEGQPIGALGSLEADWHTDMSFMDEPPLGSILYALELPTEGGDTGFSNMYAAYESLPQDVRLRIDGLVAIHDNSLTSAGTLRKGFEQVTDVTKAPGARHPLVRTHPESGRNALFLGRRTNSYVPGLSVEESEELLDFLWAHAVQPRFTWHHKWAIGDLVMWDNRCAMHRRDPFDDTERRIMHRTQIRGDRPYYSAAA